MAPINRRRFLKTAGVTLGAPTFIGVGAARKSGEPPANAPQQRVGGFGKHEVPAGHWLVNSLTYNAFVRCYDDESEVLAVLDQFLDRVTLKVIIDGEPVENTDEYWGEPYTGEIGGEETYHLGWQYAEPPKPVGAEYDIEMSLSFDPPFVMSGPQETPDGECVEQEMTFMQVPPGSVTIVDRR